ncbi:Mov34/MPN/PAD-1 family protein [uncultured Acinetobacter sp.]|uniref:Mov34/MPN/PAD-1 family protein n=1 Tax=uncultured Acinetobacter sp. TaxID=165433 RepID=UPI002589D171|nr:Mov34/MPN/PAD-1 family protein [uncultured Acinetobacter sp.]
MLNVELKVSTQVVDIFFSHQQKLNEDEKGGQLFIDTSMSDGLWLAVATSPHNADRSGPTWLELDANRCKQEALEYQKQGFVLVGYWHTHTELTPNLSPKDIKSFREFSRNNIRSLPNPLAVIVGNGANNDTIRAWSFQKNEMILASLK